MNKITGNGCPAYDLEASVGQFYEDLDTGNVYECQSITNVADTVTYNWVLRAHGEHIDDHAEIFGGGSSSGGGAFIVKLTWDEEWNGSVDKTFEEIREAAKTQPVILIDETDSDSGYGVYYKHAPLVAINAYKAVFVMESVEIEGYPSSSGGRDFIAIDNDNNLTMGALEAGGAPV